MDEISTRIAFESVEIGRSLASLTSDAVEELDFGVIGFDRTGSRGVICSHRCFCG